ncbi:cytochrome P450 [Ottowia thiooxydans]|uniref:cytochrome P450 n=1 Tax=Ottowia thiooxydans TaxID=219182 RepID=UPI0004138F59|nr:cytochrome P450 [Ottowia thiooxydans]
MTTATVEAPAGVPVVDIDPFDSNFLTSPYEDHKRLRDAGPVVWMPAYGIYGAAQHVSVHAVLNDHATFISGAGVGLANFNKEEPFRPKSLILEADPPSHTKARAILARILSPKTVMQIRARFTAEAESLVEQLLERQAAGETIDAVKHIGEAYPLKVFPDAVGVGNEGRENLLLYGDMIFNAFGPRNERLRKAAERVEPVTAWIMAHCARENLSKDGFGEQIWRAADAGEISPAEAPMLVRSFLSAGVDTTVNGIGNALLCLARHPDQYDQLHADHSLARPAFEESLRFESTVQTFFRTASRDTELMGVLIPQDSKIVTFLAAANRDERQWPNADKYDIQRRPAGHMAFGSGIHGCVGQVVARLEGEVVLTALAKRVKRIELLEEPKRRLNNTLRALASMPVRLVPV